MTRLVEFQLAQIGAQRLEDGPLGLEGRDHILVGGRRLAAGRQE
ncbi:MAG: hypothetical protein WDN03_17620 [Rhizomicrobium sp.]